MLTIPDSWFVESLWVVDRLQLRLPGWHLARLVSIPARLGSYGHGKG